MKLEHVLVGLFIVTLIVLGFASEYLKAYIWASAFNAAVH